jgi:uroporphyrinogen-III decarboxylase
MVAPKTTPLSPKERMLRALRGEAPDVLPAAPAYLILFLADFERGYYAEQVRRRLRGRSSLHIDHDEDTCIRAEAFLHAYGVFKSHPDWLEVRAGPSRAWSERTDIVTVDGNLLYEDRLTGEQTPILAPRSLTDVWDISSELRDAADVDARLPIVPAEDLLASGSFDLPRQIAAEYGDKYLITTILDTPFSDAYDLLGFQGLMLTQHDRPALLHHLLRRKLAQSQEVMAAWAATGAHAVYVEETFTGADLISPRSYDRFVFAYNQPYFRHMRSLGLLPIHYVCGDVVPRLDRICEYDIAAVAVEESKKSFTIDLEEVVKRVDGRAAVLGNIDAVRFGLQAGLDEMAAEVRRQARIGQRARGFIASTGSPFPLDTNPRLIDTLVTAAHSIPGKPERTG